MVTKKIKYTRMKMKKIMIHLITNNIRKRLHTYRKVVGKEEDLNIGITDNIQIINIINIQILMIMLNMMKINQKMMMILQTIKLVIRIKD